MNNILFIFIQIYTATIIYVSFVWLISLYLKNSGIMNIFWGIGFIYIFLLSQFLMPNNVLLSLNNIILTLLILIWGLRLSIYLYIRSVNKEENIYYHDQRIQYGKKWWWYSYFKIFLIRGSLMFIVSTPLIIGAKTNVIISKPIFLFGITIWTLGFIFEALADYQLYQFKLNVINFDKICKEGLWNLCRHPNYFGNALVWWGFFFITYQKPYAMLIISPILMTFLLVKVSGVKLLDDTLLKKKPGYQDYIDTHSAFIPNVFKLFI